LSQIEELTKTFGSRTKGLEIFYLLNGLKQVVRHGFYDKELPEVEYFCKNNHLALEKSSFKILLTEKNGYSNKGIRIETDHPEGMFFVYIAKTKETTKVTLVPDATTTCATPVFFTFCQNSAVSVLPPSSIEYSFFVIRKYPIPLPSFPRRDCLEGGSKGGRLRGGSFRIKLKEHSYDRQMWIMWGKTQWAMVE